MPTSEPSSERRHTTTRQRALREMRRAERFAETGHVSEAIASLEQAVHLGADAYTCYLRMARLYQDRRQWEQAVGAAERAIAEHPDKLSAREAVISLYLESRDYERAVTASRELLKISPRHVPARDALGAAYMGLGDLDAAMRVVTELIGLDPSNPMHRFTKAHLCQHRGEVAMAVEEFERVVVLTQEGEITESALEQLEGLDTHQLNQIMTLAQEDTVFRSKLISDADSAAIEKGFTLSERGRVTMRELAEGVLAEWEGSCRLAMYH